MCPCVNKRIVNASSETILAELSPGCPWCVSIGSIIAVMSAKPKSNLTTTISRPDCGNMTSDAYHLIDAASLVVTIFTCKKGEARTLRMFTPKFTELLSYILAPHSASPSHRTDHHAPTLSLTAYRPWSCSVLREHRLARGGNHNDLEVGEAAPPVYYALDVSAGIAGHALESILNGIGQYVTEGLRERQTPWLVPCSDEWENRSPDARAPLIWTLFFLEVNDALQFPFYTVDFHRHFDVDSPSFVPLVFSTVHFASTQFGMNALCFKLLIQSLLWPYAVQLEHRRKWTVSSEGRFEVLLSSQVLRQQNWILATHRKTTARQVTGQVTHKNCRHNQCPNSQDHRRQPRHRPHVAGSQIAASQS